MKLATSEVSDAPGNEGGGANDSDKEVFVKGKEVGGDGQKEERGN